jgi:hypothetical protein
MNKLFSKMFFTKQLKKQKTKNTIEYPSKVWLDLVLKLLRSHLSMVD